MRPTSFCVAVPKRSPQLRGSRLPTMQGLPRKASNLGRTRREPLTMDTNRANLLPSARHFAVLGEIAVHYGGMTSVVLHRSRAFALEAGLPVDILTTGHERNYPQLEAEMLADGRLVRGMRLRNMFDELQSINVSGGPIDEVRTDSTKPIEPLAPSERLQGVVRDGVEIMRV